MNWELKGHAKLCLRRFMRTDGEVSYAQCETLGIQNGNAILPSTRASRPPEPCPKPMILNPTTPHLLNSSMQDFQND